VSRFLPSEQKARPWMECECATQFISGRAVCTAWWIMYAYSTHQYLFLPPRKTRVEKGRGEREGYIPAVLSKRTGPPSTTFPSLFTRIRSEALRSGQATPKGFTQKDVGSTGSCSAGHVSIHLILTFSLLTSAAGAPKER
jgi:hypothetical protein